MSVSTMPDKTSVQPSFIVTYPQQQTAPFIFSSPHSGALYTREFLAQSRLDEHAIRRSEDLFVDDLFNDMPKLGAPLLSATFPRAYLDVNREPYELDPKMFSGKLPPYANTRSVRVAGGLGTIARVVAESQEIYHSRLPVSEALQRIETHYKPYHLQLQQLISDTRARYDSAFLIDCHSMPSGNTGTARPDFVLGDRYGASCNLELTEHLARNLSHLGYKVSRNKPYAGGFITEHYGRPSVGLHALQLEINRGLYADEINLARNHHFQSLKNDLNIVFKQVFAAMQTNVTLPQPVYPLAAE